MQQIKIGLALGGGVARSITTIGVLNVLAREQIGFDYLAGTSAASIIGAIYASGASIEETNRIALNVRWNDLAALAWPHPLIGVFSNAPIAEFLAKHCRCKFFEELSIPFGVTAADLMSGAERLFTTGAIAPAVRASCSIPGVFQPVRIGKRVYIDGCYDNQIPAHALRQMGAQFVIGCDVSRGAVITRRKVPRNMFTLWRHLLLLNSHKTANQGRRESDLLIPITVHDINLMALRKSALLIRRGEEAAEAMLPQLKARLRELNR
jgi:NTE family protein